MVIRALTTVFFGITVLAPGAAAGNPPAGPAAHYEDATYVIAGRQIRLHEGESTVEAAPGAASKIVTRYFGNEMRMDLDADGREDVVFLVTQETGGSGTFFYLVAALNTADGYVGSQALFLGDRIAPRTTERRDGLVVVNYATRAPGEPFSVQPGIGRSLYLKFDPGTRRFGEFAPGPGDDHDLQRMTLGMKIWIWVRTLYSNDVEVTPRGTDAFTLAFEDDRFSATTDCNSMSGRYSADGHGLSFSDIAATRMYCAESQEDEFARVLDAARSYHFTARGELVLELKLDTGAAVFR